MRRFGIIVVALLAACGPALGEPTRPDVRDQWANWRGPLGTGVAPNGNPPVEWGEGRNVRWKTELPGRGHSTPIIWEDRIFLTTAVPFGEVSYARDWMAIRGTIGKPPVEHPKRPIEGFACRRD